MTKSCEMCSEDELSKILFKSIKVKKSEIRIKSENLHPFSWLFTQYQGKIKLHFSNMGSGFLSFS